VTFDQDDPWPNPGPPITIPRDKPIAPPSPAQVSSHTEPRWTVADGFRLGVGFMLAQLLLAAAAAVVILLVSRAMEMPLR